MVMSILLCPQGLIKGTNKKNMLFSLWYSIYYRRLRAIFFQSVVETFIITGYLVFAFLTEDENAIVLAVRLF